MPDLDTETGTGTLQELAGHVKDTRAVYRDAVASGNNLGDELGAFISAATELADAVLALEKPVLRGVDTKDAVYGPTVTMHKFIDKSALTGASAAEILLATYIEVRTQVERAIEKATELQPRMEPRLFVRWEQPVLRTSQDPT